MANEMLSASLASDQEKYLASKLLKRSMLKLVCASVCEKIQQPQGSGSVAYFIRYKRMNLPMVSITEGVDPANNTFSLETISVALDQWGDIVTLTDVAILTTKHPLLQTAIELLSDNAQRVIDREVQIVWLQGTNVQFSDGTVASRRTITAAMSLTDKALHRARIGLTDSGAPPRNGPSGSGGTTTGSANGSINGGSAYIAIAGPQVIGDIMANSSGTGAWIASQQYKGGGALYNAEVGIWLGIRWVETNFIPKFSMLGNTTAAVASGAAFGTNTPTVTVGGSGSSLSAVTYFFKLTRKDKLRGFEEDISIAHSIAVGAGQTLSFGFGAVSAGYVYNIYMDSVQAGGTGSDATLKLVAANIDPSVTTTYVVSAIGTGTTPPDNVNPTGTPVIHPVYIHGQDSCVWVGLQNLTTHITKDESTIGNVLKLKRAVGYKFMAKAMIRDQTRMLRLEVASGF